MALPRLWPGFDSRSAHAYFNSTDDKNKAFLYQDGFCADNQQILTVSFKLKDEFFEWMQLQNFSKSHVRGLSAYFKRHFDGKKFNSPMDIQKYIYKNKTGIKSLILTSRTYLKFCEQYEKYPSELIEKYRKVLKFKRGKQDVYVPSNEELLKNFEIIKNNKTVRLVYLILTTSGIRLEECLEFLRSYDPNRFKIYSNYVSYSVGELRHCKNINNIYLPKFVFDELFKVDTSYQSVRTKFRKKGTTLSLKYLRKWNYNFLIYSGMPESVADFIQGRTSKSVSANHYFAKSQQAEFWYEKVVEKLEKIIL